MSHRHACDAGHYWECDGNALRPLSGDATPSVCMCIRHRTPMEVGNHSECSIEILTCPEHREEQLSRMDETKAAQTDPQEVKFHDGWDDLLRPMTPAETIQFEAKHQFMDEVVFVGLKNLNTGFDSPGIQHFSPTDFGEVINRCERLKVSPIGIEIFTTAGGFVDCEIRPEDVSPGGVYNWARQVVENYQEMSEITMTFTFDVPDSLLDLSSLSADSEVSDV